MRLNGLGAGTSVFSARYVGLRHDPRNRRPRQPHVHGCQPRRQPSGDPRRGDHLRLHGPRFLEETDPSGRKDADHRHLRPRQPPRLIHQGAVGLLFGEAENRHAHRAGERHPRQKTVEELYPVDAGGGLRLASTLNAFSYIYPGRQVQAAIGYANTSKRPVRLELRPETTSGALRPTIRNRSRRANGVKSTSPTSSPPTNPATGPCATRWRS